ncbi:MAG TPA: WYL domain-containing protein [Gemmatimonadaceae bacterium]|nr:WYL domain-containing protein [Gemmatimonadaceae bacterium]
MDRDLILRALDQRRTLRLVYGDSGVHVVQPHAIVRKGDGTELLEAYQVGGPTPTSSDHGWRHFDLSRVTDLELLTTRFDPRRDFRPVSGQSGIVVAQVHRDAPLPS